MDESDEHRGDGAGGQRQAQYGCRQHRQRDIHTHVEVVADKHLAYDHENIHHPEILYSLQSFSKASISSLSMLSTAVTNLSFLKSSNSLTLILYDDPFTRLFSPVIPRGMSGGKMAEKPLVNTVSPSSTAPSIRSIAPENIHG